MIDPLVADEVDALGCVHLQIFRHLEIFSYRRPRCPVAAGKTAQALAALILSRPPTQ